MNGRKIASIGVLVAVLVCSILAAGCTDTPKEITSTDIIGIWDGVDSSGMHGYFAFYENGTGVRSIAMVPEDQVDAFVWNVTGTGCDMVFGTSGVKLRVPLQMDENHKTLIDSSGIVLTRQTVSL